jgi:hypothetical protein
MFDRTGRKVVSRPYLTASEMERVRILIGGRGHAIVQQVAELRLMTAQQIGAVHFPPENHESPGAAARAARRTLTQLTELNLLVRTGRTIGGIRAGSSGYLYALGPLGHRLAGISGIQRKFREPSAAFIDHTLTATQLVVDLTLAARQGACELLAVQGEPRCWRRLPGDQGMPSLRPDLFVSLGVGEWEHRYFVEIDRSHEHLPALIRKSYRYDDYFHSQVEQKRHGVFPRVCWSVPDQDRAQRLLTAIKRETQLLFEMFIVVINKNVVPTLIGGAS